MQKHAHGNASSTLALRLIAVIGAALTAAALAGCNTVEGAGKDIEAAGDAIEDAADDAND